MLGIGVVQDERADVARARRRPGRNSRGGVGAQRQLLVRLPHLRRQCRACGCEAARRRRWCEGEVVRVAGAQFVAGSSSSCRTSAVAQQQLAQLLRAAGAVGPCAPRSLLAVRGVQYDSPDRATCDSHHPTRTGWQGCTSSGCDPSAARPAGPTSRRAVNSRLLGGILGALNAGGCTKSRSKRHTKELLRTHAPRHCCKRWLPFSCRPDSRPANITAVKAP